MQIDKAKSRARPPRRILRGLRNLALTILLGGVLWDHFTLVVRVGEESKIIIADLDDFARIMDDSQNLIIAVDGEPVMRKGHSYSCWVPMVLLSEGEHTLTVESGNHGLYEKPEMEISQLTFHVQAGQYYRLARKAGLFYRLMGKDGQWELEAR